MIIRQKIREDENRIKAMLMKNKARDCAVWRAWDRLMDYFSTKDYLEGSNHVQIIKYIYLRKHYLKESFFSVAWKNYIGERTLYRYRKKYIECFAKYYMEEQSVINLNEEKGKFY